MERVCGWVVGWDSKRVGEWNSEWVGMWVGEWMGKGAIGLVGGRLGGWVSEWMSVWDVEWVGGWVEGWVNFTPCVIFNVNPLNPELNPICYLLALLAHHFLHVSRIRVKSLTLRLLMSYIYIYIYIYAEILGSNPTGGMDICLLWLSCVVR